MRGVKLNKSNTNHHNDQAFIPMKIISTGVSLPPNKIESSSIDIRLNKPNGYTLKRSGIEHRFHADKNQSQIDLAVEAINNALEAKNIDAESIDLLICASAIPHQALPYTAAHILKASKLRNGLSCFDINASCVSFIVALHTAACLINSNCYSRIAIVSSELASRGLNWDDEESSLIFGDGSACAIIEKGDGRSGILSYLLETYSEGLDLCQIKAGGTNRNIKTEMHDSDFMFKMQGKPLFKISSLLIEPFFSKLIESSGFSLSEIKTIVPHQASHLSLMHMRKRLNISEDALIDIYKFRGNQIAASVPTALHAAFSMNRVQPNEPTMLIGTAAGLSFAGMVFLP
jgi:3-oxoacyl-[acyl-carrier-protein] synthase III